MIYGVALLAGCMFAGSFIGNLLGLLTGLDSDIGGVGFAMILLILLTNIAMFSNFVSAKVTRGRIHASAIAIFLGLILSYIGGRVAGGSKGLADVTMFAGIGVLGGSSLRDFAIISTAYGAMTATFYTGLGCLLCPSVLYFLVKIFLP